MSITAEMEALIESPDTSNWLKSALRSALTRDCTDAVSDAEVLYRILDRHAEATLEAARATLNLRPELDQWSADLGLSSQGVRR